MSAPYVAGSIALLVAQKPRGEPLKFDEVYDALVKSSIMSDGVDGLPGIHDPEKLSCSGVANDSFPNYGFGYGEVNVRFLRSRMPIQRAFALLPEGQL